LQLPCIYIDQNPYGLGSRHLSERTFDRKRISANSNPNLNPKPKSNPKTQKPFRVKEMTSFFGQASRYHGLHTQQK